MFVKADDGVTTLATLLLLSATSPKKRPAIVQTTTTPRCNTQDMPRIYLEDNLRLLVLATRNSSGGRTLLALLKRLPLL
jgi:hypothetical protein